MKKIKLNTIVCSVVSLLLFSYICVIFAFDATGAERLQYASDDELVIYSDDEVVIHSPFNKNNARAVKKVVSRNLVSANDLNDAGYDEMVKYLEKEKAYLEKLDSKYRKTLGIDSGNEDKYKNKVKVIQDNKEIVAEKVKKEDISQEETKPEKVNVEIVTKVEKNLKDESPTNEFVALGKINYDNPYEAAEVFYEMSKYTEAIKMYKSLQKNLPNEKDFVWAQFQIANSYRNLGKFDKAVQGYQDFINAYPDNFWTEQASWYLEDAKWWKEWGSRITVSNE
ncbi:MAG: tetratricopeptide repeat protein [Candidatus Anammoxibacter sp.]